MREARRHEDRWQPDRRPRLPLQPGPVANGEFVPRAPTAAEVALRDKVLQPQALAGVPAGDIDHQAQVGAHHAVAGLAVAVLDAVGQLLLLLGVEQRRLVDLAEVGLQRRLDRIIP